MTDLKANGNSPHLVQQGCEHESEPRDVSEAIKDRVGIQLNHTLAAFQQRGVPIAVLSKGVTGSPSQTDVSSESAAEKDLVEITESLDS